MRVKNYKTKCSVLIGTSKDKVIELSEQHNHAPDSVAVEVCKLRKRGWGTVKHWVNTISGSDFFSKSANGS